MAERAERAAKVPSMTIQRCASNCDRACRRTTPWTSAAEVAVEEVVAAEVVAEEEAGWRQPNHLRHLSAFARLPVNGQVLLWPPHIVSRAAHSVNSERHCRTSASR
jgi:hypothetical protein